MDNNNLIIRDADIEALRELSTTSRIRLETAGLMGCRPSIALVPDEERAAKVADAVKADRDVRNAQAISGIGKHKRGT